MIGGFSIEPHAVTFLFWRVAEPQYEYAIKIASTHIETL
jgi:hypothetical protein